MPKNSIFYIFLLFILKAEKKKRKEKSAGQIFCTIIF